MFFVLAALIASLGPGNVATAAMLAPMAMAVGTRASIPPFLMAIMVGNGAQSGALSPLAPTGVIVTPLMEKIGLGGHEWQTYAMNLAAHAMVAFAGYALFGGWRLFKQTVFRATPTETDGGHALLDRALGDDRDDRRACCSPCCSSSANIGMAAFTGAVGARGAARRRSRAGDSPHAVDSDPDGQRRQRARRAARQDRRPRSLYRSARQARHAWHADRCHRVRDRPDLGLQQHVRRRAAGVPADRAWPRRAARRAIRSASPRR